MPAPNEPACAAYRGLPESRIPRRFRCVGGAVVQSIKMPRAAGAIASISVQPAFRQATLFMAREFSAGGGVIRRMQGRWWMAAIEPQGKRKPGATEPSVLALPKGIVDQGESAPIAAQREVLEETGIEAALVGKLKDIK